MYSTKYVTMQECNTYQCYLCRENVLIFVVGFELYENSNHDFSVLIFFKLAPHFLLHLQLAPAPQLTIVKITKFYSHGHFPWNHIFLFCNLSYCIVKVGWIHKTFFARVYSFFHFPTLCILSSMEAGVEALL